MSKSLFPLSAKIAKRRPTADAFYGPSVSMKALSKLLLTGGWCISLSVSGIAPAIADVPPFIERGVAWTHTASSCSIDPQSMAKAALSGADFSFQANVFSDLNSNTLAFEPIIARCNVLNPLDQDPVIENPPWNALIVGYASPVGMSSRTLVVARLFAVSRNTGALSIIATFNSTNFNVTTRTEELVLFTQPMDFRHNEYYVELDLTRLPNTSQNPVVYSVRLVLVNALPP